MRRKAVLHAAQQLGPRWLEAGPGELRRLQRQQRLTKHRPPGGQSPGEERGSREGHGTEEQPVDGQAGDSATNPADHGKHVLTAGRATAKP